MQEWMMAMASFSVSVSSLLDDASSSSDCTALDGEMINE
jgi:hypothetical protein